MGNDRLEKQFDENWRGASNYPGAYHYRPTKQNRRLFIKTVSLKKGDLSGFRY
jgi:hypothetical protein